MILLDTHVIVWLAFAPHRISPKAKSALQETVETGSKTCISPITLYEIGFLANRKRIQLNVSIESFLYQVADEFLLKPITVELIVEAAQFPLSFPGDPMDRIIAATALTQGIPLVTADERIRRSKVVKTIW